ncbi:AAA domain-containing protein [Paenibacillus kobensis]|uniref:AAA domain-containing protein n=1 Tax=Paenibacillus kobensis TaxID=59841 RepID=UPI0013E3978A|nr:AAA domain-containing protein [Paenibacillus kobensis]
MDERKVLIITDQGDKTSEIDNYLVQENWVYIQFYSRDEPYRFSATKILIKTKPISLDLCDKNVIYEGIPLQNVHEVLDFGEIIKVFFENQQTQIYSSHLIKIESMGHEHTQTESILHYWNDIAQYTKPEDESEAYLKKQFSKLNSIHHNSVLASYIKGAEITQSEPASVPNIYPFRFNLSQKEALEKALLNKISIIEGPPGTGKTQTILNILANLTVMQNKSVAVVSGNNAAVQNVKDKLRKYGYEFIAASLGNLENKKAFFSNLPEYRVTEWNNEIQMEVITETINGLSLRLSRLMELANRRAKLGQEITAFRLEQKHFQLHNQEQNYVEMERLFYRRQTAETIIAFLVDEYFSGNRAFRFLHKIKLLFKYGFINFKDLKENRLNLITSLQMKYYESKLNELEEERSGIQRELDGESFDNLIDQHEANSTLLFKQQLYNKYRDKTIYSGNLKNYLNKNKFDEFIEHFPIVLSTTHALRSCIPDNYLFDYVIIDEASQVDLLTGVLAMSCCKQVVIVGDTKQLPQIVDEGIQSMLKTADVDESYNYFKHSLLSSMLSIYGENVPKVMLKEHYRCSPKIIGFCNDQYYNNELIPFTIEESAVSIRLHYTAAGNHMRKVTVGKQKGSFNHREIDVVKEEILNELQLCNISIDDIGFTSPYRLQVEEANSRLDEEIEIDTVHKYQGREKPIMILSTVLDQSRNGQIGKKFVENPNLVNVAVSRAQKQFILVTDHKVFRDSRKDIGNLIRYIEYNTFHEHITQSELISVFDLLYTEYSERLNVLQNRMISKSRYKSENIMWRVLSDLIREDQYKAVTFGMQIYLKDVFNDTDRLSEREKKYVINRASFDFVIYDAINKQPLLAIEVDGFASHRNNPDQTERDKLKNSICEKYQMPMLRLPTTGSNEITKLRNKLDRILNQ